MKKFFVDLYHDVRNWYVIDKGVNWCKENKTMACIVFAVGLLVFFTLIAIICRACHNKKLKKKGAKNATQAVEKTAKESLEELAPTLQKAVEPKQEPVQEVTAEEKAPQPVVAETTPPPIAESAPTVEEKPVVQAAPVAEQAPVEKAEQKPVAKAEEKPAATPATPVAATVEKEVPAKKATAKKSAPKEGTAKGNDKPKSAAKPAQKATTPEVLLSHYEEGETDKIARYAGKWVICRVLTNVEENEEMYFFELRASNGEKLLSSEEYTSYQGVLRGVETHKANILKNNFKITLSKKGDYIFKLLNGKNTLLCTGENYPTRARCEKARDSAIRFAETAILDENVQDIVVKVPKEEDGALPPLPENCTGKWIISSLPSADGEKIYYFELFANNGEKLLSSEEYTTYIGAVNGVQTHKKNIEANNFRISLTKRGDYIYKLLNGNGQLLCLGEHYKTKRLCQRAVESVKRFALNSSMLKNSGD